MLKDWCTYAVIPLLLAQLSIASWRYDVQQRKQYARKIAYVAQDGGVERASALKFACQPLLSEGLIR